MNKYVYEGRTLEEAKEKALTELKITEEDAIKQITDDTLLIILDTHKEGYVEFPSVLANSKHRIINKCFSSYF